MAFSRSALSGLWTFARAGSARYFDAEGVMQIAIADAWRLDHHPATLAPRGLLIEPARTNLFLYSQAFTNGVWTPIGVTPTDNVSAALDGTTTVATLIEDTSTGFHYVQQNVSVAAATTYAVHAEMQAIGSRDFAISFTLPGSIAVSAIINRTTGAVTGATNCTVFPESLGGGRWRIVTICTTVGSGTANFRFMAYNGSTSYLGDGASGARIWGAQNEAGLFATSYIPTTSATVTRLADDATATITDLYNSDGSTIMVYGSYLNGSGIDAGLRTLFQIDDGTAANRVQIYNKSGTIGAGLVAKNSATQADIAGAAASSLAFKAAIRLAKNDFAVAVNGVAMTPDTAGFIPAGLTTLRVGKTLTQHGGVHLLKTMINPGRVSDASLLAMTA